MKLRTIITILSVLSAAICGYTQNYSTDVELQEISGNLVSLQSSASAEKKKDAEDLAIKSAFHTLLTSGIEGLKNGTPMLTELPNDYKFRFFSEGRYINFIEGTPQVTRKKKIANQHRYTVQVLIDLKSLKSDLETNRLPLSPSWSDRKKAAATAALNPMIVIVPYVDASTGYSFDAMRQQFEGDQIKRLTIDKVAEAFQKHGYKTYDFINILQDSKINDMLRQGSQTDDATMIVQNLPGDIVVTAEVNVSQRGSVSELNLNIRALEKQTSGRLATQNFNSGGLYTKDPATLVSFAVNKIQSDFFSQLDAAFNDIVRKGREVNIEMNLSESVSDWDFESDSPETGDYFKDVLDEWLRDNAMQQVYDMSRSTDKYIRISIKVPLWDMDKNRPFTLSNFSSKLRRFFRQQLGDMYKASTTSMGQKIVVTIE